MKYLVPLLLFIFSLCLVSCKADPVCPPETGTPQYLSLPPEELPTPAPAGTAAIPVMIGGKEVLVDKIVSGPLCNDTWSGAVYVTCDVQVYAWEETPTFLKECNLQIEPDTVVYVAYHNDTAYYNGCSCHTGEIGEP